MILVYRRNRLIASARVESDVVPLRRCAARLVIGADELIERGGIEDARGRVVDLAHERTNTTRSGIGALRARARIRVSDACEGRE
jgi:hypothetical protein